MHVLDYLFWHVNRQALTSSKRHVVLHAGVVCDPTRGAVLLPAESGSGKSTLTAALVRSGYGYLSDEAAPLDLVAPVVHPYAHALSVKSGSPLREWALADLDRTHRADMSAWHVRPEDIRPGCRVGVPQPVAAVVFPTYTPGVRATLTPLPPGEACLALAKHLLNLTTGVPAGTALGALARVARRAPAWQLRHDELDEAVELVRGVVAHGAALPVAEPEPEPLRT